MDKQQEIINRLTPTHIAEVLPPDTEDMKKEILEGTSIKKESDPSHELKTRVEYPFSFEWKSPNGKVWKGEFVNKVLSIQDRQNKGIAMAKFAGGMPVESLDALTYEINIIVAHMMFSLVKFPEWAKDLRALHEIQLLQAIYEEVASHEATFFGFGKAQERGQG
jgi:hypothetical protein